MDSEIKGMSRSNLKTHVTTTMNISPSNCWLQNDVWKKYAYHTHTVLQSVGLSTSATLCPVNHESRAGSALSSLSFGTRGRLHK